MLIAGTTLLAAIGVVSAITVWPGQSPRVSGHVDALSAAAIRARYAGQAGSLTTATPLADGWLAESMARPRTKSQASAAQSPTATPKAKPVKKHHHAPVQPVAAPPVYLNPLRSVSGLIPERIDMGADFGGSGPIYALGNAIITNATAASPGWPGGGWITYQLTSGPAAGLQVYVAEDVTPTVQIGQQVTSSTVIADMYNGSAGIETGWAMPDGSSAESQLAVAGGVSGQGPFPTMVGVNFDDLLQALGVPAAPNAGQTAYGTLPSNYPTDWASLSTTG